MAARDWAASGRRIMAYAALPWFRLELPGWRRLSSPLGLNIGHERLWSGLAPFSCRGKLHGYQMELHMEDWCDRLTFFLGRYYDLELQKLLQAFLKSGDTFVDIGANIGMITLMAARCVGPGGEIIAFEPNPANVERLARVMKANGIENVTVLPIGLGDRAETLPLQTVVGSSGWGTFTQRPQSTGLTYRTVMVTTKRADDVLPNTLAKRTFIKIDAEGFECRILRGMQSRLRQRPAVVTELEPELLQMAGGSVVELCRQMTETGYEAFYYNVRGRSLKLRRAVINGDATSPRDVLWLHPESPFQEQLKEVLS